MEDPSIKQPTFWYIIQIISWIILGFLFYLFRKQSRKYGESKKIYINILFYSVVIIFLFCLYIMNSLDCVVDWEQYKELLWYEIFFLSLVLVIFTSSVKVPESEGNFSAEVWIRRKLIKPLKIYKSLGILNEFAFALADATDQNVDEVLEKLDDSKSLEANCYQFGIRFKRDINKAFDIISKHKKQMLDKILPKCPDDRSCNVLDKNIEDFYKELSENIFINVDLSEIGLEVSSQLPENILVALNRAELYYKVFRIYNFDSYGPSVIELAKSLEELMKIIMDMFISSKNLENYIKDYGYDSRIKEELPIIKLIQKGVGKYTLGQFLYVIRDTYSYPSEFRLREEMDTFLKENWPINLSDMKRLSDITNNRNTAAHIAGEIITPQDYSIFRGLIIDMINNLKIDLTEMSSILSNKKLEHPSIA